MTISAYNLAIGVKQRRYPYEAVIKSGLRVADEFCIAYDKRFDDPEIFTAIDSRVRPIEMNIDFLEWDFICKALTTARRACNGDWCLYLEMDEVIHEKDYDKILKAVDVAQKGNREAINIKYLCMYQDYVLPKYFFANGNRRQKLTINKPFIYHKTSDYMIGKMDSAIWEGKFIKKGYDSVAYYDERTSAWFHYPNACFPDENYLKPENPKREDIEYNTENYTYIWHYTRYNHSRKTGQGWQTGKWQDRVYGRSAIFDVEELEGNLKETIVLNKILSQNGLEHIKSKGAIAANLKHPNLVSGWIKSMGIDANGE